jgi:branched-chain amino acid transport system substrate-binding protein
MVSGCPQRVRRHGVRIGLEAPLSGDQKILGGMLEGEAGGVQLSTAGGINGKQVTIVPIDDAADPTTGVTAAKKAIADGLDGVVGPYNSGVGAETLPLYIADGLVPIRLTSADSTNGLGFTLQPMTYQIAPEASEAITTWAKAKSVAIVYDDTTLYTKSVSEALKSELGTSGTKITDYQRSGRSRRTTPRS